MIHFDLAGADALRWSVGEKPLRSQAPRIVSGLTTLGSALVLAVGGAGPAYSENSAPPASQAVGFTVTSATTLDDLVADLVQTWGVDGVVQFFDEAVSGQIGIPAIGISPRETEQVVAALTSGRALDASVAGSLVDTEGAPVSSKLSAVEQETASGADDVGTGVEENTKISNGYAWLMRDYLIYIHCPIGPLSCRITDRIDFKFVINPGPNSTKIDESFQRQGEGKLAQRVIVKAQLVRDGKEVAADRDEWNTPGTGKQYVHTSSTQKGKTLRFKMTFVANSPDGPAVGTGWTGTTKKCTASNCRW